MRRMNLSLSEILSKKKPILKFNYPAKIEFLQLDKPLDDGLYLISMYVPDTGQQVSVFMLIDYEVGGDQFFTQLFQMRVFKDGVGSNSSTCLFYDSTDYSLNLTLWDRTQAQLEFAMEGEIYKL